MGWLEIVRQVGPYLIIGFLGPREIWMISLTGIAGLLMWIVGGLCENCIHGFGQRLMSKENRTLFKHMVHNLTVSTACICGLFWADLVYQDWHLSF